MKKQEIFAETVKIVSEITEIEPERILDNKVKQEDVVDARHILVKKLHDLGFYTSEIAYYTGICNRNLYNILNNFDTRIKNRKIFEILYEQTLNKR